MTATGVAGLMPLVGSAVMGGGGTTGSGAIGVREGGMPSLV